MQPPRIVPARNAADLTDVVALFRAYAASLPVDLAYQNFDTELATLPGKYAPPRGVLLLARLADGRPVGCVAMRPMDSVAACEMKRLYVSPEGRGMGLGSRLVSALVEIARAAGHTEMWLDTLPTMTEAQSLYRRLGFDPVEPYYETPVSGTLFMRLKLA